MFKKFIVFIKKIRGIKLRFDLPNSKKIVIFDEENSTILKNIIKRDCNILNVRGGKEIFFWVFLKQIFFLDLRFLTYCKNYLKFVSPKIVITTIDTSIQFYELKKSFVNIKFISIQNGYRFKNWFRHKNIVGSKRFFCDHFFVFNNLIIKNYLKLINSNFHILGSLKNNDIKINKTKFYKQFLFISQFQDSGEKNFIQFQKKLLKLINLYMINSKKKIHIILRSKDCLNQNREIEFYKKIFQNNCNFYKSSNWKKNYELLDKFENIIFIYSTLGYEAISRKKKVAIFSPRKIQGYKYNFGWPLNDENRYNFFSTQILNFKEVKRVLDNINGCSQNVWQKKYYKEIKNQLFLDKNNLKLKKVISQLLKN